MKEDNSDDNLDNVCMMLFFVVDILDLWKFMGCLVVEKFWVWVFWKNWKCWLMDSGDSILDDDRVDGLGIDCLGFCGWWGYWGRKIMIYL